MRQRVMIAMALALEPAVVIMDEPTTALDVVTQREILTELADLQRELSFAVLFITHDLSLLVELADSIAVMYAGRLLEQAAASDLYRAPRHPYTLGLLRSFPPLHGARKPLAGIPGSPPDLRIPPPGCPFHPRCGFVMDICRTEMPAAIQVGAGRGRSAACWLHDGSHEVPAELALPEPGVASPPGTARGHAGIPEPGTHSPAAGTETGAGVETGDGTRTGAGAETGNGTETGARTEGGTQPAAARLTAAMPPGTTTAAPDTTGTLR
jgi:peptide/nickel transport system ATP-binding protein